MALSSVLTSALQRWSTRNMKCGKIHYIKTNNNKYCAHTQYLRSLWMPSVCYKVSKLVPTPMAFLGKFVDFVFRGTKFFTYTSLCINCSLPSILTLTCWPTCWRYVAPCKYVGRFAASPGSRRSTVRLPHVPERRRFTGL